MATLSVLVFIISQDKAQSDSNVFLNNEDPVNNQEVTDAMKDLVDKEVIRDTIDDHALTNGMNGMNP